MKAAIMLAVMFAACSFGPAAFATPETRRAWEFVAGGVEMAGAWLAVGALASMLPDAKDTAAVQVVALIGALYAAQTVFRLGFPMDARPQTGGLSMGEALFGPWVWFADVAAFFWGVAYVAQGLSHGRRTDRR